MEKYYGVFFVPFMVDILLFYILSSFGMIEYVDWLVMMVGLVLTLQLSLIMCLLVYLVELLRKDEKGINNEKSAAS